jgi:hypothetical protein
VRWREPVVEVADPWITLAAIATSTAGVREEADEDPAEPYDVVAALPPDGDPAPYAAAGATWWVVDFPGDAVSVDLVRGVIRDGPFAEAK